MPMKLQKDIREFVELLLSRKVDFEDFLIPVIGKSALEANKQATGRPQDLADLARLRRQT
jgi:hypothetical protein